METLNTADGLQLHLQRWPLPGPAGSGKGLVQIVHGLGEHIGRYEALAVELNAAGWQVAGHDQRGHGRSGGPRGDIPGPSALLQDLALVFDHLHGPGAPIPHVLLGHSMGGLVAARFAAEALQPRPAAWSRPLQGLVLSSPALDAGLGPAQRALLAVLGRLAPHLRVGNGLQPSWISRDPEVVRRYVADPLVHNRVTPQMVRFIVDEGAFVRRQAAQWQTPTLLLWAGADRCVAPAGSAALATAAPATVLQAQVFPGLFHEIFNEPERGEVIARLTSWMTRLPSRF